MPDSDNGVAKDGGHTPAIRLTHVAAFFGIGHPCSDQLTPVKTRYQLTD